MKEWGRASNWMLVALPGTSSTEVKNEQDRRSVIRHWMPIL
jgi:hypothetical protein